MVRSASFVLFQRNCSESASSYSVCVCARNLYRIFQSLTHPCFSSFHSNKAAIAFGTGRSGIGKKYEKYHESLLRRGASTRTLCVSHGLTSHHLPGHLLFFGISPQSNDDDDVSFVLRCAFHERIKLKDISSNKNHTHAPYRLFFIPTDCGIHWRRHHKDQQGSPQDKREPSPLFAGFRHHLDPSG